MAMQCVANYRDKLPGLTDSDSDSDSERGWKREKPKPSIVAPKDFLEPQSSVPDGLQCGGNAIPIKPKRKVNNIWSSVLQEQSVSDVFKSCGLKSKPITLQDRSCESYDFRLKYSDPREDFDEEEGDMETDCMEGESQNSTASKVSNRAALKIKQEDILVGRKICKVLNEKKRQLIVRVVHIVGAEKAMELLKKTEELEEQGGMKTKDNSRRRTPGGVYLQLLKADKDITKKQVKLIFKEEDRIAFLQMKKKGLLMKKRKNKKSKASKLKAKTEVPNTGDMEVHNVLENRSLWPTLEPMEDCVAAVNSPSVEASDPSECTDSDIEDGEIKD